MSDSTTNKRIPAIPLHPPADATTQVWLMGSWRISQYGKACDLPTGQPRALLAYLLLQPTHAALRTTLVDELFPESPGERGRRYLSDALYRLRRALDPAPILADAESVMLDMTRGWWVDVWAFEAASASADNAIRIAGLGLYSPEVAPEITDHWILVPRMRLQERFVQSALEVAADAERSHDHSRAETVYRRALTIDPLLESAHRGLMRTLARNGQLAAALEHYDTLVDRLEREIAAPPSSETRLLADQLYQELDLARRRAETRTLRRLVGRVEERSRLLSTLDQARAGQAGIVVLLGEAGMGKSALLRDLAHAADWRGWQIHWGVSHDDTSPAPYAPLTIALHAALPAPRAAQLATLLPPIYHDLLARLFPQLQATGTLPDAAVEAKRLPQALAQLLNALQEIAPLLLLLENVQWGDTALWALLHELFPLIRQQRVLLVLSAQPEALQSNAKAWAQLESWDRDGWAQIVALAGLTPAALDELVELHHAAAPLTPTATTSPADAKALHAASGGNPLLALEILAVGTPDALLASRPAIATLVTARLGRLSMDARQAASIAAILGSAVTYAEWETLWQAEHPYGGELAPQAAELERAEVLQITAHGYSFAHDTLHAAALAEMDAPTRQRRHAAALTMLEAMEASAPPDPLRLLRHAQGSENYAAIVCYALQAGERAISAFAFDRAEEHFTLALEHIPHAPNAEHHAQQVRALLGRIRARHVMAARAGELDDLNALRALPLTREQQLTLLTRLAEYHLTVSEMEAAQRAAQEALGMDDVVDAPQRAALYLLIARAARDRSQLQLAQTQLTTARNLYQTHHDAWGVAMTTDILGGLAWDQGDYERSAALHEAAADAFQTIGDQIHEAQSLNNLGSAYWELGRYADARATHERSILVCRELGNKLSESDNIDNLGGVAWALGDYTLAIRQYRAALDLREAINDLWGVAISLSNLASAYRMQGSYEQALDHYRRALPLYEQVGRTRGKAYVMEGEGQTLLALGHLEEAWARLQDALVLRTEIGDRTHLIELHAMRVHAALARQKLADGRAAGDAMLALLTPSDRASLRQQGYFAAFHLAEAEADTSRAMRYLALALQARDEMAAALPASDRARFLQNVPLNRDLAQAAARYCHAEEVTVGLGKQAKRITWTMREAEDALLEDESVRRRHILARLLAQAAAQDAVPTHDQLAASLGVSRRTILRDLALLASDTAENPGNIL